MVFLTLFCFCCGFFRLITYQDDATDVSSQEANEKFRRAWSFVRVPEEAKHVNLHARFQGGGADFDISEEDFLAWSKGQGWKATEQQSMPPAPPLIVEFDVPNVRHCYEFSNGTHRGGWSVMYDIERKRAWIHLSPR